MSLRRSEPPRTVAPLESQSNQKPNPFHEEADEPWLRSFEGGQELQQPARVVHFRVSDESAQLAHRLVDDRGGSREEALSDGLAPGFGVGVEVVRSGSELREDGDNGEPLERRLWKPEFLQKRSIRLHRCKPSVTGW